MWIWISSITIEQSEPFELVKELERIYPHIINRTEKTADYLKDYLLQLHYQRGQKAFAQFKDVAETLRACEKTRLLGHYYGFRNFFLQVYVSLPILQELNLFCQFEKGTPLLQAAYVPLYHAAL
jgi:hypothetical protein